MVTDKGISLGGSHRCPECSALVKFSSAGGRSKKVRCPNCRAAVVLESLEAEIRPALETRSVAENETESRIKALEARVAKLEEALAAALRASSGGGARLKWIVPIAGSEFSPAQAEVLQHNLSTISAHRITIQAVAGDESARERAQWFKDVFVRARWPVCGPELTSARLLRTSLSLATTLPVPPEAAATFLALRAAGFPLEASFDPDLPGAEERLIVA